MNLEPIGLRTRAMFARIDDDAARTAELAEAFYGLARDILGETDPPEPELVMDGATPTVQTEIDGITVRVKRLFKKDEVDYILETRRHSAWYTIENLAQLARLLNLQPDA